MDQEKVLTRVKEIIDNRGYAEYNEILKGVEEFNLEEEDFDVIWEYMDINRIELKIDDIYEGEDELFEAKKPSEVNNYLLVWNPNKSEFIDYDELLEMRSDFSEETQTDWSCNKAKPECGDYVYLLVCGRNINNGIIARGIVESWTEDYDWDEERGNIQHYVLWNVLGVLDYRKENILLQSYLEKEMPGQFWRPVASGIKIKKEYVEQLDKMWRETYLSVTGECEWVFRDLEED